MFTENLQMQVRAAEIIAEHTLNGLAKYKSDLMYELFNVRSIEQFNNIPYNTVRIVNGKVVYNEEVIKELFIGFLNGAWDELNTGFWGFIRLTFQTFKNLRIIRLCNKLYKENKKIYDLYISPIGDKNVFKTLCKKKDELLIQLDVADEDDIEYCGGLEKYIQESMHLDQIISDFAKDMEPTVKLIQKLNKFTK